MKTLFAETYSLGIYHKRHIRHVWRTLRCNPEYRELRKHGCRFSVEAAIPCSIAFDDLMQHQLQIFVHGPESHLLLFKLKTIEIKLYGVDIV